MVNLLYDLKATQPNVTGKRHGGGRYGEIVFKRMVERGIKFACFYDSSRWLNPEIKTICESAQIPLFDLNAEALTDIVRKNGITRIYSALPDVLCINACNEVFGTIHGLRDLETPCDNIFYRYKFRMKDLIYFLVKKYFKPLYINIRKKQFSKRYINDSFNLITVSEHSRYALYSYFPEFKNREIPVFYSPNTAEAGLDVCCKRDYEEKYFLLVSGNRWEKNNLRAIMAFDRLLTSGLIDKRIRMKVTGTTGDSYKYKLRNPDSFDMLGYVDDVSLEHLYANAYAFVYPSLNEGFGYPPLEAMKYGVPVLASPLSSITEICGGAAIYYNPFSVEEIMNRLLMILRTDIHGDFSNKGIAQYQYIKDRQNKDLDMLIDYIIK